MGSCLGFAFPMKNIAALLVAGLLAAGLTAQEFEGTVVWKMRAEISDTAVRSQIQAAQAQLASPEIQAQMKEAQAALQSPEMQEMMKQNPQMRTMLEQQMSALKAPAAAPVGGPTANMFPTGFTLKARGQRTLVTVEGGMFPGETLSLEDQHVSYQIDRAAKTYRRLPQETQLPTSEAHAYRIARTGETVRILSYNCTRWQVESSGEGDNTAYSIWVTKEIKGLDPRQFNQLRAGRDSGPDFLSQLDGVPLKLEATTPEAKMTMEMVAIKAEKLPAALFELPAGFTDTTAP